MSIANILVRGTMADIKKDSVSGEARPGILVPVDPSASAFNSIEYALNVARILNTSIHLIYIIDFDELPESGNPIVINRMLDRLESKAAKCVESLKEMIEESGIDVPTAESIIGKTEAVIEKRIQLQMPEFIIIGRDSFSKPVISAIAKKTPCPILFIPKESRACLPTSLGLTLKTQPSPKALLPLFKLVQHTTKQITVLETRKNGNSQFTRFQNSLTDLNFTISIDVQQMDESISVSGINNFIEENTIDLLCVTRRKNSLLTEIFSRDETAHYVDKLRVPLLVIE